MKTVIKTAGPILLSIIIILGSIYMLAYNLTRVKVRYSATEGGRIEGAAKQSIIKGNDATTVTAVADYGYKFVGWSDNTEFSEERTDRYVVKNIKATAKFERIVLNCNYYAGEHGRIEGETKQVINYGKNSKTVVAVPDNGYKFTGWSDGFKSAERTDLKIQKNISVTAMFGQIEKTFILDYKFGEVEDKKNEINLVYNNLETTNLPVPVREHFTFGGWYLGETQIANENGILLLGKEIFDLKGTEIYAKWTANETFTYRILLVYVTEVKAQLTKRYRDGVVDVDYKMTDKEREICHEQTRQLKIYLDDMLDGLVNFIVDEYYTTVPLGNDSVFAGNAGDGKNGITNYIYPDDILETKELYDNYQTVLSVVSFNDYDYQLHNSSGSAFEKYGMIHLDSLLLALYSNTNYPSGVYPNDITKLNWTSGTTTFIHETIHTIETRVDTIQPRYHEVSAYYNKKDIIKSYIIQKLYLLNESFIDDERLGIPHEFWGNDELVI